MGFTKPDFPNVDPDTFLQKPLMERMRILVADWAENGFGAPRMVHTIYIVKLIVFFAIGGITVATATSGLPAFWHVTEWWNQPIVYQKVILWTVLLESIGVAKEQPWLPNGPIPTEVTWSLSTAKPAAREDQEHGHGALA